MEKEMLQLEQYVNIHPIKKLDKKYRIAYVSLIKYICGKYSGKDQWCKSMITLMKDELAGGENYLSVQIKDNNRIVFKGKQGSFFRYKFYQSRYYILIDCLFIVAFNDKKKGKGILKKIYKIFPRNAKKFLMLFELFYQPDITLIKKDFPELLAIFKVLKTDRDYLRRTQKIIMVTANMSAGKSTLLNALIGKKINKTQNDTCTAKIHYLYNKAGEDGLSYELDFELALNATRKELMEDNENNISSEIMVGTRFRSLEEIDDKVCFIDTPGVNSSQNQEHRELTNKMISEENCDLLLVLLNGENIGTCDVVRHLIDVHERYHGEVVFVINKLDWFKQGTDSVPETLLRVKEELQKFGYQNPRVYPISAYAAYLAKMYLYGEELSEDEIDELEYRKRKLSREEYQYYRYYDVETPKINEKDEIEILLRNSGILSLERILY